MDLRLTQGYKNIITVAPAKLALYEDGASPFGFPLGGMTGMHVFPRERSRGTAL